MLEITSTNYMILIIDIMIVSGALGGMLSAVLSWRDDQSFLGLIFKNTLTGIVMAMTVPLILNMFSSDLLDTGQARPLRLFILGGLCIFVALFSTIVLERICGSRLKREEQCHPIRDHQCGEQSNEKKETIGGAVTIQEPGEEKMPINQLKILETLASVEGVTMTLADLLRHTMIPQKNFDEAISLMKANGLVVQELTGGRKPMLILTELGRQRVLLEFPLRAGHY